MGLSETAADRGEAILAVTVAAAVVTAVDIDKNTCVCDQLADPNLLLGRVLGAIHNDGEFAETVIEHKSGLLY